MLRAQRRRFKIELKPVKIVVAKTSEIDPACLHQVLFNGTNPIVAVVEIMEASNGPPQTACRAGQDSPFQICSIQRRDAIAIRTGWAIEFAITKPCLLDAPSILRKKGLPGMGKIVKSGCEKPGTESLLGACHGIPDTLPDQRPPATIGPDGDDAGCRVPAEEPGIGGCGVVGHAMRSGCERTVQGREGVKEKRRMAGGGVACHYPRG